MSDEVKAAGTQGAAVAAIALWVIVGVALAYGIFETAQKVTALFGG
ncbi:hypothetical protein LWF15_33250 [Kineosporia rhizophila]|nr:MULTISPECIES: hypothetical protein [Kineosporia]MCE0540372.1 hypothetical protein [Kineosporia rhizophila]GLY16624.1 hypothetical protein Kisp01_36390 [Kineosporia sp. NBRC 101677]